MKNLKTNTSMLRSLSTAGAILLAMTLSTGATAQKQNSDQKTCASMGASYGSPTYTACMLEQQQRRDQKMSVFLEQQLMHQELGRPAREKLEEKKERRARDKWCDERRD